jgi:DNA-entry nuclease
MKNNLIKYLLSLVLLCSLLFSGCNAEDVSNLLDQVQAEQEQTDTSVGTLDEIPKFSGEAYVVLNDNQPDFTDEEKTTEAFETYSELDSLGRCGVAYANICEEIMPTEERGAIGQVKPSGWHTVKYDFVDGKYLYNRCHLIGYQLAGENANECNLITGTRYLNIEGMLPFENEVADYVKETGNHVLYRVTPIFTGDNLVADGVEMEGWSVEDEGEGVCFHIFAYNSQPGVTIDYATGESRLADTEDAAQDTQSETSDPSKEQTYILNKSSHKFHLSSCSGAAEIKASNRKEYTGSRADLINQGYSPCGRCNP